MSVCACEGGERKKGKENVKMLYISRQSSHLSILDREFKESIW